MLLTGELLPLFLLMGAAHGRLCPEPVCPPDEADNRTVLLPSGDCSKFYSCTWGFPTLLTCPPGLRFNETIPGCVLEEMADCSQCEDPKSAEVEETNPELQQSSDKEDALEFINYFPFLH